MEILGRRYDTGEAVTVSTEQGRIARLALAEDRPGLPWISSGWCDLQINGYGGQEFSCPRLTVEKVEEVIRRCHGFGVTSLCPTVTTNADEVFRHAFAVLAEAIDCNSIVMASVLGIHLEGPYLSPHDGPRGAHAKHFCRPPNWDEFRGWQDVARGNIKLITLSPEYESAPAFIRQAVESGVVVALGHLAANTEQIKAAVDSGATLSTHLGNGANLTLPRHPNYLWDQLAEDRLTASLIVDGHHLPPAVVKTFVRAKTPERIILVSDLSGMAGQPAGRYTTELCDLEILPSGRIVLAGQTQLLAAASAPIGVGIANVMRDAGVSLREAVDMASVLPARLLGHADRKLTIGAPVDLTLFDVAPDCAVCVCATIVGGNVVYRSSDTALSQTAP